MSRLDDELRRALRREDPGEDFTRQVLAAVASRQEAPHGWRDRLGAWFAVPALRWAAIAATVVVLVAGGSEYARERRLRSEGQHAKAQLMLAMRIAGTKLHVAQTKVIGISE